MTCADNFADNWQLPGLPFCDIPIVERFEWCCIRQGAGEIIYFRWIIHDSSGYVINELDDAPSEKRDKMIALIEKYNITVLAITNDADAIALRY